MPQISLIPVQLYQPLDPYEHSVDNRPFEGTLERIQAINSITDNNSATLGAAAGNAGSVANRLNQSLENNGYLQTEAVDAANHSIEAHTDTSSFVRMTYDERVKLSMIAPDATSLTLAFDTISGIVPFINDSVLVGGSDSIQWSYQSGQIFAHTNFPSSVRHTHYYDITPVDQNLITPTRQYYYVNSLATPYREGSLRIYVNGIRLDQSGSVYVPIGAPGTVSYQAIGFTEDSASSGIVPTGGFTLSTILPVGAVIRIDFDVLYS